MSYRYCIEYCSRCCLLSVVALTHDGSQLQYSTVVTLILSYIQLFSCNLYKTTRVPLYHILHIRHISSPRTKLGHRARRIFFTTL